MTVLEQLEQQQTNELDAAHLVYSAHLEEERQALYAQVQATYADVCDVC